VDSFASEEENDEEDTETDPEALRLREALASGDVDTARELIQELSQDQISMAVSDQNVECAVQFLSAAVADRLRQISSPQFLLRGKPRVVTLAEVSEKCGPVYGPFCTFSFGDRPPGWGAAASENRILSWKDQGFGQIGDQIVDIDDRYITARPLDEFEGALISGPLDSVEFQELPEEQGVTRWKGRPLSMEAFDPRLFREIFSAWSKAYSQLLWTYDFQGYAAVREACLYFTHHDGADEHADILLAKATLDEDDKESLEKLRKAVVLDPSLKRWADLIEAWRSFKDSMDMKQIAGLRHTDPLGSAIFTACQTFVDLKDGKDVSLDQIEACGGIQHYPTSPYLSKIFENAILMCVDEMRNGVDDLDKGGDPRFYAQAIRIGYRGDPTISWLIYAIKGGANDFVRLCLDSGFKPAGRYTGGTYLNLLTMAAANNNLEAVKAFLKHGADPDETSHYGGLGTLAYYEGQVEVAGREHCSNEIMEALRVARRPQP
jgi:hypothetical protein